MLHLLTLDPSDTVAAFQLLDRLRLVSETECLHVCRAVVDRLTRPRDIKFVIGFLLQFLSQHLSPDDVENLRLKRIGAKVGVWHGGWIVVRACLVSVNLMFVGW